MVSGSTASGGSSIKGRRISGTARVVGNIYRRAPRPNESLALDGNVILGIRLDFRLGNQRQVNRRSRQRYLVGKTGRVADKLFDDLLLFAGRRKCVSL